MKKPLLLLIFSLIVQNLALAQWTPQNSGTTEILTEVQFVNANVGYIAGWNGTLLKTTDGGANWTSLSPFTDKNISALFFIDENKGFIGDELGLFSKTEDGGLTWEINNLSQNSLSSIYFLNGNIGFVAYRDAIFRTADGGDSWVEVNSPAVSYVEDFSFPSETVGYAVSGGVLKTTDGGLNWLQVKDDSSPDYNGANILTSCEMITEDFGFFTSPYYLGLYTTTDGANSLSFEPMIIDDIDFPSPALGYVLEYFGQNILKTEDAGTNWTNVYNDPTGRLFGLFFIDENVGWAVGDDGVILHTTIGGILPTAITDRNLLAKAISIFPNPTSTYLNIEMPATHREAISTISVFDALGRNVLEVAPVTTQVNLERLVAGQYTLLVKMKDGEEAAKQFLVE